MNALLLAAAFTCAGIICYTDYMATHRGKKQRHIKQVKTVEASTPAPPETSKMKMEDLPHV